MLQNPKRIWHILAAMIFTAAIAFTGCKKEFDEPPAYLDPNIPVNYTIAALKASHVNGQVEAITQDYVIAGIVNADDRSGNYYKQISIQDTSGGITIRLDATNLYADFPVGRKVYVKLKGLYLGDYNGLIQLGGSPDAAGTNVLGIASNLISQFLIKGSPNNTITPKVVTVAQLNPSLQSMLVQLDNAEFVTSDTSKTYADAVTPASANRSVKQCSGSSVIVRTSGYANFAGVNLPNGNGTLQAIYTIFGSTSQLIVRDTSDVRFTGTRCGTGPSTLMNIADVRALFTGTTTSAPQGRSITGIVISDTVNKNLNNRNIVLQQGNGLSGILVRFDAPHPYLQGDSITVNIGGQEISEFNGLLQLNNVPLGNGSLIARGKTITPRTATVADINTNFEAWESTLIKVVGVTLTPAGTYSGSKTITQGTNTIVLYTATGATFAGTTMPTGNVDLVGYLTQGSTALTKQVSIRNTTDVTGGTPGGGGGGGATGITLGAATYTQNFDNMTASLPTGFFVKIGARADTIGRDMPIYNSDLSLKTPWAQTSAGVKNFASATGLASTAADADQAAATNRVLGIRQTSAAGYDPGSAYYILLNNTTGKSNLKLRFDLQSLDATIGRTTTWKVEYGFGANPASFTEVVSVPTPITSSNAFGSVTYNVDFGSALNNQGQNVWIRIVTLTGTTGTGSRPSTGLDNVSIMFN